MRTSSLLLLLTVASCAAEAVPAAMPEAGLQFRDSGPDMVQAPANDTEPPVGDVSPPADSTAGTTSPEGVTLYVNLGDSLAAGYYASGKHSYRALLVKNDDLLHPAQVGKDLSSRFSGLAVADKSKSGATTSDVVGQALSVSGNPAGHTLVTISAGGNDFNDKILTMVDPLKADAAAAAAVANLKQIVDHFRDKARFPDGSTIAMLLVHDPTDGTGSIPLKPGLDGFCKTIQGPLGLLLGPIAIANLDRFNKRLSAFAASNGLVLVDNHARFLGHGFHHDNTSTPHYDAADPTLWFHNDCAHGNDRGHHELRLLFWTALFGS